MLMSQNPLLSLFISHTQTNEILATGHGYFESVPLIIRFFIFKLIPIVVSLTILFRAGYAAQGSMSDSHSSKSQRDLSKYWESNLSETGFTFSDYHYTVSQAPTAVIQKKSLDARKSSRFHLLPSPTTSNFCTQ